MKSQYTFGIIAVVLIVVIGVYITTRPNATSTKPSLPPSVTAATPEHVTLIGTYTCLPLLDAAAPNSDCAFGIKTDSGDYYAVNFGASAGSMADFKASAHIKAKGFIILRGDLRPDNWKKFSMLGLFTITEKPELQ